MLVLGKVLASLSRSEDLLQEQRTVLTPVAPDQTQVVHDEKSTLKYGNYIRILLTLSGNKIYPQILSLVRLDAWNTSMSIFGQID